MENQSCLSPTSLGQLSKLAVVPVLIVIGLLALSPNYQKLDSSTPQPLSYPWGGDYLQDYIGGQLIVDPTIREDLYDAATFQSAQHEPRRIGFSWDKKQFFPAVYPPFWYAAVSPLSKLSYLTAANVWLIVMATALTVALWLLVRFANVPLPLMVLMCLSPPVIQSLNAGQKGTLLLLILSASYVLLQKGRSFWSGLVFSMIAFKPHLGIAIGLWIFASKNWRWVAGTFAGLALLVGASFLISPSLVNEYVNVVIGFGDYVQSGGYKLHESFSLWGFWQQLIGQPMVAKILTVVGSLAMLLASLLWFRTGTGKELSIDLNQAFSALVIVTVLVAPHLYTYDLTLLLLPIGLLARIALSSQADSERNYLVWAPVGLLILTMFVSGTITQLAQVTSLQLGVVALLIAWALIKRPFFWERSPVS